MPANHNIDPCAQSQSTHERIKSERKRLNLTQAEAAEVFNVKRETWNKHESGKSLPKLNTLAVLLKSGADVLYILTGKRSENPVEKELLHQFGIAHLALQMAALAALRAGNEVMNAD